MSLWEKVLCCASIFCTGEEEGIYNNACWLDLGAEVRYKVRMVYMKLYVPHFLCILADGRLEARAEVNKLSLQKKHIFLQ